MTIQKLDAVLIAHNRNIRIAVRALSQDERLAMLVEYFLLASPIKNRCQNVTDSETKIIRMMCELYNQFLSNAGGHFTRIKPSACQLPNNLAIVRRFLIGAGRL